MTTERLVDQLQDEVRSRYRYRLWIEDRAGSLSRTVPTQRLCKLQRDEIWNYYKGQINTSFTCRLGKGVPHRHRRHNLNEDLVREEDRSVFTGGLPRWVSTQRLVGQIQDEGGCSRCRYRLRVDDSAGGLTSSVPSQWLVGLRQPLNIDSERDR